MQENVFPCFSLLQVGKIYNMMVQRLHAIRKICATEMYGMQGSM